MPNYIIRGDLQIDSVLFDLIANYICPATDTRSNDYWQGLSQLFARFTPKNQALLDVRKDLEQKISNWYHSHPNTSVKQQQTYLKEIGYLQDVGADFYIETTNIDDDIARIPAPQLVVPLNNARYALNAANARWGSLLDALYGSNIIDTSNGQEITRQLNLKRAQAVFAYAVDFLDNTLALKHRSFSEVKSFHIQHAELRMTLVNGETSQLLDNSLFVGYTGNPNHPKSILFKHNSLHIQLVFDKNHPISATNQADICDVICEAAVTVIQDAEDSVAAVDGKDKALVYRNWFQLMQGDLSVSFEKNGKTIHRNLASNKPFISPTGDPFELSGKCTLFVRNVGHLMTTPAILDKDGNELPEGILDACVTTLAALNDIRGKQGCYGNTQTGSIYIVKPKMHGPDEVAFTDELFAAVEELLNLPQYTIKMGIMDEERRTSVNLKECIRAAKNRVVFINTGFLDRTGDEIHTSMNAGVFMRKYNIKQATWLSTYEKQNVEIGLQCGFHRRAQIGKGMWAVPDDLKGMMQTKLSHPQSGASTSWVPSPTAATLHALHYHKTDVWENQQQVMQREPSEMSKLLTLPLANPQQWSNAEIQSELNNNCQGLLGYTVKWIDAGIGCSKVADINQVDLMEDRATVRISSQLIANWLHHGVVSQEQVEETLKRMATIVDQQNANDSHYQPMAPQFDGIAFQAAKDLIFKGVAITNGYTEPILHSHRLHQKNVSTTSTPSKEVSSKTSHSALTKS